MTKRNITQQATVNPMSDSASVNALKCQFMTDIELADIMWPRHGRAASVRAFIPRTVLWFNACFAQKGDI
jgi:hypothetical protein